MDAYPTLQSIMQHMPAYMLVAARSSGLFFVAPIFGIQRAPEIFRVSFALIVALIVYPFVLYQPTDIPSNTIQYLLVALQELVIGLTYGWVAQLLFEGMVLAGQFIGLQMGFAQANILNPMSETQRPLLSEIYFLLTIFIFFSVDGHHLLVMAFHKSFTAIPLGQFLFNGLILERIFTLFAQIFIIALIISAPICGVLTMIDLIMGVIARTAPQMNVLVLGFAIKIYLGLLTLLLSLPFTFAYIHNLLETLLAQIVVIF